MVARTPLDPDQRLLRPGCRRNWRMAFDPRRSNIEVAGIATHRRVISEKLALEGGEGGRRLGGVARKPDFLELGIIYPNAQKLRGKSLKLLDCTITQHLLSR